MNRTSLSSLVVHNRWLSSMVLLFVLLLVFIAWWSMKESVNSQLQHRFDSKVSEIEKSIQERIQTQVISLIHIRAVFQTRPHLSDMQFHYLIRNLGVDYHLPGQQAVGFIRVSKDLKKISKLMVEPEISWLALPASFFAQPWNQNAMAKARDLNAPTLTEPFYLNPSQTEEGLGVMIYLPVYENENPSLEAERRGSIEGFLFAPISIQKFFNDLYGSPDKSHEIVNFSIWSQPIDNEKNSSSVQSHLYSRFENLPLSETLLVHQKVVSLLNSRWVVVFRNLPLLLKGYDRWMPFVVGVSGVLIFVLIFAIARTTSYYVEVEDKNRSLMKISEQQVRQQAETFQKLNDVSRTILSQVNFEDLFRRIPLILRDLSKSEYAALFKSLNEMPESVFEMVGTEGLDPDDLKLEGFSKAFLQKHLKKDSSIHSQSLGASIVANKLLKNEIKFQSWLVSYLGDRHGNIKAVVLVSRKQKKPYSEQDIALVEGVCTQTVIAFQNASLVQKADDANRAKSAFLANMSHEIRTPLGALIGYADILSKADLSSSEKEKMARNLQKNSEQITSIIDDILNLSKIEAGKMVLKKTWFRLASFVAEIEKLMEFRAEEKGLRFEVKSHGFLPAQMFSDEVRVKQILLNLVGNAVKFTHFGTVSLQLHWVPKEGNWLEFEVIDTGQGIASEKVDQLFTPFFQGDSSSTRKYGGTGLGLALSQRLAEELGGELSLVATKENQGSHFLFRLPCGEISREMKWIRSLSFDDEKGSFIDDESLFSLKGQNILLVEDSPDNQEIFQFFLESAGAQVTIVDNGLEAVERGLNSSFHMILMDIHIPGIDGKEATRRLRQGGFTRPVVAVTAHALAEEKASCLAAGCSSQITKPVSGEELVKQVNLSLQNYQSLHI